MSRIRNIVADYQILAPDDLNELIFNSYRKSLGKETAERISRQLENYEYYNGKQHRNTYGELVKASEVERPPGLDYDPTRIDNNYFKAFIDRKARWQMGGKHGIAVPRRQIDAVEDILSDDYVPSEEQRKENERAEAYERLLYKLWDENRMRARLVQAARDRLIADRVVAKIVYNDRTGKLRWIFRPDSEYIPVYSEDDFEDLIACHFVKGVTVEINDEDVAAIQKQTFTLEDGKAYVEEAIYRESDLRLLETIQEKTPLGLDFIPVQEFPVNELLTETIPQSEISALREQNDVLNQLLEDAVDAYKFDLFGIWTMTNVAPGSSEGVQIAPGALIEIQSQGDTKAADFKKVESSFQYKDTFETIFNRVKATMHEISGLPQVVPQDLQTGGINGDALQVLFHDIITDTEEHWLSWGYNLAELHEKSIRYLQARVSRRNFGYDKKVVLNIGDNYDNEMRFVLPLPDNRKELVELLDLEVAAGFESSKGAMERLGVENVQAKVQEIESERSKRRGISVVNYGEEVEEIDGE